ncbi:MAG: ybeY [Phycisphaerales bacterium]|nr:ybeY [Phycisphaerales bacterium]
MAVLKDTGRTTSFDYIAVAGCPHLPYLAYLKKLMPKAAALVKRAPESVSIALVGDTKMAALHVEFMNIPGPTDVLTFELDHDARGRCTAGEIVICPSYAKREAKKRKTTVNQELLLYALHGLLHLSGYDDRTPADYQKMHREEDRILMAIGVGSVFEGISGS